MTEETQDVYFNLFKYCYDIIKNTYRYMENWKNEYINLKEFDENILDLKPIGKTNNLG